jgi:hypothetical protein
MTYCKRATVDICMIYDHAGLLEERPHFRHCHNLFVT